MDRESAWEALNLRIENPVTLRHSLAVEAVMRRLAKHFDDDEAQWGLAGLVHDIDLERIADDPKQHSLVGAELLENMSYDTTVVFAVRAHNPAHGIPRRRLIDKALYAANAAVNLTLAAVMRSREKSLDNLTPERLLALHSDALFAPQAERKDIEACDRLDLTLSEFYGLNMEALMAARAELGI